MNPYESCPVFEDDNFKLRLIEAGDTVIIITSQLGLQDISDILDSKK